MHGPTSPSLVAVDPSTPARTLAAPHAFEVAGVAGCAIVPAYQAAHTVASVVEGLQQELGCDPLAVLVIDDGSTDGTGDRARACGARVVRCEPNGGKGTALLRGLTEALALGYGIALSVDADGQHPAPSARALVAASPDPSALVLGVRDLVRDGAPPKNRFSNGASNFFLSHFSGRALADTQCGLRRYPVAATLALGARARGYAFEAEVILRALAAGVPLVEYPVQVFYPCEAERVTHFDSVKDPLRIIGAVVRTLYDVRLGRRAPEPLRTAGASGRRTRP
jgi:glycosyltransferase involved in cell wall biosynthesis